jgi:hypothetical protein
VGRVNWPAGWGSPSEAAAADFASQKRLQAQIVCAMLSVMDEKHATQDRSTERRLKEQFDDLYRTGIVLASLLKAEGA